VDPVKVTGTYEITLSEYADGDEYEWRWCLSSSMDCEIAYGAASFRWSALWAAKRAARRHLKGLPPVRKRAVKPNSVRYNPTVTK
jgi:hypothetical protein